VTRALLFPKAILRAEFEAAAPTREAMRIKREGLRAKRATRERQNLIKQRKKAPVNIGSKMVCTECRHVGAEVRPDWSPHVNKPHI
jgi:hypothetical protein